MRKGEPHCRACNEARQERRFHRLLAAPCYRLKKNGPLGLAELMFLMSTPELKGNLIPVIAAPLRRSSVTESVALPPNIGERNSRPSSARAVRTVRRS